jgi:branched-chain amino acid transport system substrate-binding protein
LLSTLLILAACGGTRLPNSAFTQQTLAGGSQQGTTAGGTGTGTGTGGSGTTSHGGSGHGSQASGGGGLPSAGGSGGSTGLGSVGGGSGGGSTSGGSGGGGGSTSKGSGGGSGGGKSGGSTAANTASDRGVTASTITVCNVVTQGGPFGPYQFTPSYYGAAAYFAALNAAGGINGRRVNFISHPDDGSDSGDLAQIHTCIDTDKAFAFVANDIYQYGGASYVNAKDVPDIGSQPISTAYYLYPHLYDIDGDHVPRNGKTLGLNGNNYRTDEDGVFFKEKEGIKHVGVVYYDQASSQYGANNIAQTFRTAGVKVSTYQVNLGLPNFASAVAQMKSDGVDLVADAVDLNGSQKLCEAIQQNSAFLNQMKIKLSTIADWTQSLGSDLASTPGCLSKSWSDSYSANFDDTSNPQVADFQRAIHKYFPGDVSHNHQFALEGYAGAMWFTDAARSCGANLTRSCVEKYMNRNQPYNARGLLVPNVGFNLKSPSYFNGVSTQCVSAAQWSVAKHGWVTRASPSRSCFPSRGFTFTLTAPT